MPILPPNERCRLRQEHIFKRWIITHLDNDELAWSGSRWVPIGGSVQICNFDTRGQADGYASSLGFQVVE